VTGLTEGSGLFLALCAARASLSGAALEIAAIIVVTLASLRALVWLGYFSALKTAAPTRTLAVMQRARWWLFAFGLALPVVLVLAAFAQASWMPLLFGGAGLSTAVAGALIKFVLVTKAAFNQGFALAHTPVRGSGSAGPGLKPGWSMR
jgi:phenylacetyl-CoA:acceptor oxidoreductase subunit 2